MEKAVNEGDMLELFERAKERIMGREEKIERYKEDFKKYERIFLYGAGTDAKMCYEMLKEILEGKEVAFIDKNEQKHGMEIAPNIFCRSIDFMYGYGEKAIIIITSSAFAEQIEKELTKSEYQRADKLLNTTINAEFVSLAFNNNELREYLKYKKEIITAFKLIENERGRKELYYNFKNAIRKYSFKGYSADDFLPYDETKNSEFLKEFLEENLKEKDGTFICAGYFTADKIFHIDEAAKDKYKKMYDFEINRLYIERELQNNLLNDKITVINAALGEKNYRADINMRGVGVNYHNFIEYASDDFCEVKSLDEMIKNGEIEGKITLAKIAVEKCAHLVLEGMKETIKHDKPILVIEYTQSYVLPKESHFYLINYLFNLVPNYKFKTITHPYEKLDGGTTLYAYI